MASQAVSQSLDLLEDMRRCEGAALARDLEANLGAIQAEQEHIAARAPELPRFWREKVAARLAELFPEGAPVDEMRLAQEVALMAQRRDLAEELARLDSHLHFKSDGHIWVDNLVVARQYIGPARVE